MASLCRWRSGDVLRDALHFFDGDPALKASLSRGALHAAAAEGRAGDLEAMLDALSSVLQLKADKRAERTKRKVVNQRDVQDQTALMLACQAGSLGCVRLLLDAGANPTLADGLHSTCLHAAARAGAADVLQLLLGDSTWVDTATGGRILLRDAFIVDLQGRHHKFVDGQSVEVLAPLHLAACRGHEAAAEVLVSRGAKLSVRCSVFSEDEGSWPPLSTPLHMAAANGHRRIVQLLLRAWSQQPTPSRGPDLRALEDFRGRIPADIASAAGHTRLSRILDPDFPIQQAIRPSPPSFPTLAALAAETLRRLLQSQLDAISDSRDKAEEQQPQQAEQAGEGGAGLAHAIPSAAAWQTEPAPPAEPESAAAGAAAGTNGSPASAAASPWTRTIDVPSPAWEAQLAGLHLRSASAPAGPSTSASALDFAFRDLEGACSVCLVRRSGGGSRLTLARTASGTRHSLGRDSGSQHSLARRSGSWHSAGSSTRSGTAASSHDSTSTCPICFDRWGRPCMVQAAGCRHRLYLACARQLCQPATGLPGRKAEPVRCPMCRSIVGSWITAAAAPPAAPVGASHDLA